jgi:hypothetical protein
MLRAVPIAALSLSLVACQGNVPVPASGSQPEMGLQSTSAVRSVRDSNKPTFGVGLAAAMASGYGSDGFVYQYCEVKQDDFETCPAVEWGKTISGYSASRTIVSQGYNYGSTGTAVQHATSGLGEFRYYQNDVANFYISSEMNAAWNDVLHIQSKTLHKGAPVSLGVSLTLEPGYYAYLECYPYGATAGKEYFYGPGYVSIYGQCNYTENFELTIGSPNGPPGTQATGTLETKVGATLPIGGGATTSAYTCEGGACEDEQTFTAGLGGTVKWRIVKIPAGVTYTTDSGHRYSQ